MELAPRGIPDFPAVLSKDTQALSVWNRVNGKESTTKYIIFLLEDLNNYFNIARPMSTAQIVDVAVEFVNQIWWARMEEIIAFFEAMKKGTYGKIYERLDPSIIWEQWDAYDAARTRYCEDKAQLQSFKDPNLRDDRMEKRMDGFAGALSAFKQKFQPPKKKEP